MKKKNQFVLRMIVICFLLGSFVIENDVYGEELHEEAEVSVPVVGTLQDNKIGEENVSDLNDEDNIGETIPTIIKDRSLQKLPSTGETVSFNLLLIGLLVIALFLALRMYFRRSLKK